MEDKRHKNIRWHRKSLLEDDIIEQCIEPLQKINAFLHQEMCHRSLMFENLKLHAELHGYMYKKKIVVFNAE